jgi:hypothetical protein
MAVRLSALRAGCPLSPGRFLVLISIRGWVDPRAIVRLEGLDQLKIPPAHQNPKNSARRHLRVKWCWRYSRITKAHLDSTTYPRGTQSPAPGTATSFRMIRDQSSDQNIMDCSELVPYRCVTTPGHILPVWQLRRSGTFISSVSLFRRTRLTLPLVTTVLLGHLGRVLMERLSEATKKCKRRCMSGYTCSKKNVLSQGIQALVKHRRICTERNEEYVEKNVVPNLFALN